MIKRMFVVTFLLAVSVLSVAAVQAQNLDLTFQPGAPEGGLAVGIPVQENLDLLLSARVSDINSPKIQGGVRFNLAPIDRVVPFAQVMVAFTDHNPRYTLSGGFSYQVSTNFAVVGRAGLQSVSDDLLSFSLLGLKFSM